MLACRQLAGRFVCSASQSVSQPVNQPALLDRSPLKQKPEAEAGLARAAGKKKAAELFSWSETGDTNGTNQATGQVEAPPSKSK